MASYCDRVVPFLINDLNVAGRLVRLDGVSTDILQRHNYPPAVASLLSELLALAALLGSALKFDGRFVIQTKSKGPVSMLVADYTSEGCIRGYAQYDAAAVDAASNFASLVGEGYVAFSVDQGPDMERYQGIVPLEGETLADVALSYFERSEQIPTYLELCAGSMHLPGSETGWRAGGIMLQQIARDGGVAAQSLSQDDWTRLGLLLSTASSEEMLDTDLEEADLAYRLFNEDGVRLLDSKSLSFGCGCSADRVTAMLSGLPEDERVDINKDPSITVTCEFCSTAYEIKTPI
jgi:molecular chaperone Hsp33